MGTTGAHSRSTVSGSGLEVKGGFFEGSTGLRAASGMDGFEKPGRGCENPGAAGTQAEWGDGLK